MQRTCSVWFVSSLVDRQPVAFASFTLPRFLLFIRLPALSSVSAVRSYQARRTRLPQDRGKGFCKPRHPEHCRKMRLYCKKATLPVLLTHLGRNGEEQGGRPW